MLELTREHLIAKSKVLVETENLARLRKKYNEDLEEQVHERAVELEAINTQKDQLLSIIGHDLRNPASSIIYFSGNLYRYPEKLGPKWIRQYTQDIREIGKKFGLELCKRLLEMHGSTLKVKSEKGKGQRFILR